MFKAASLIVLFSLTFLKVDAQSDVLNTRISIKIKKQTMVEILGLVLRDSAGLLPPAAFPFPAAVDDSAVFLLGAECHQVPPGCPVAGVRTDVFGAADRGDFDVEPVHFFPFSLIPALSTLPRISATKRSSLASGLSASLPCLASFSAHADRVNSADSKRSRRNCWFILLVG